MSIRPVRHASVARPTMEGAGVHLHRVFGFGDPSLTDPFLMMDDFRNDRAEDYIKGFPWHPHRGSRRSPTCSRARSSIATALATSVCSALGMSNG